MIKKNLHNRNTDKFNYKKEYQYGRLVQDGGVEGNAHISCESTKITTCYRKTTDRRTLELTKKKRCSCPKTKEKLQQDSRRGAITIKSNPIPVGCASHTLEKNNTKEGCERSEPHIRLPSQGIRRKGCESPGNLTLRASEGV